eukprot:290959-Chlamydomonas_euryale.AAC.1
MRAFPTHLRLCAGAVRNAAPPFCLWTEAATARTLTSLTELMLLCAQPSREATPTRSCVGG